MRCYNGHIPESDYKARYGYTQRAYANLRNKHPHIHITYFPIEGMYSACVPDESYRSIGPMCSDKMDCLKQAIQLTTT